jgi:uncharacterized membrane protein YecN with MAPEG domain
MHVPSITAFYLAILALIYAALALRVAGLRRASRTLFGDADNTKLRAAIRVHANFIEYVPIIALLVALLEMSGMPTTRVHLLMGALLLTRLLHPIGMSARPRTWQFNAGRVGGILLTLAVLVAAAISALVRFWPF